MILHQNQKELRVSYQGEKACSLSTTTGLEYSLSWKYFKSSKSNQTFNTEFVFIHCQVSPHSSSRQSSFSFRSLRCDQSVASMASTLQDSVQSSCWTVGLVLVFAVTIFSTLLCPWHSQDSWLLFWFSSQEEAPTCSYDSNDSFVFISFRLQTCEVLWQSWSQSQAQSKRDPCVFSSDKQGRCPSPWWRFNLLQNLTKIFKFKTSCVALASSRRFDLRHKISMYGNSIPSITQVQDTHLVSRRNIVIAHFTRIFGTCACVLPAHRIGIGSYLNLKVKAIADDCLWFVFLESSLCYY